MAASKLLEPRVLSTNERKVSTEVYRRLPTLDGIRGVAILLVLAHHALFAFTFSLLFGHLGVSIFFVLSGFLITRVMLADEKKHGQLRLRRFYTRRALRILPAFYFFLAALALLSTFGVIPEPSRFEWEACALYFRNLIGGHWQTGHIWSLSLEEQFYLLWPAVFIVTRKFRIPFIFVAILAFTGYRGYWIHSHALDWRIYERPDLRLDTFLMGCAFAIGKPEWIRRANGAYLLAALLVWFPLSYHAALQPVSTPLTALLIAALIWKLVDAPGDPLAKLLSSRALVFIGEISYSLYLWQQLFLGNGVQWWSFPALFAVAVISYFVIELPFLRLKDRQNSAHKTVIRFGRSSASAA